MKKIIIVLIAYSFIIVNGQIFTTSLFKNKVFVLDGFRSDLIQYDENAKPEKKLSLRNISRKAVFDFIVHSDDFNIYLTDCNSGVIYLLDENLKLKKSSDIKNKHNIEIYRKIFPSEYNGLIISSKDKNEIFRLRNNKLERIISTETEFNDFFADKDFIYLLFKSRISVYTHSGSYAKNIAVPSDQNFSDFVLNDFRIYLKSDSSIIAVNRINRQFSKLDIDDIASFTAIDSTLYYFSADSLKLMKVGL